MERVIFPPTQKLELGLISKSQGVGGLIKQEGTYSSVAHPLHYRYYLEIRKEEYKTLRDFTTD